jgi:transcriptional regulator with XRE-family HTH domain
MAPAYLKEYRALAGLTLQQVADRLGLKPPSVHKWEKELTSPTLRDLIRLAEIYGIAPETFFLHPEIAATQANADDRLAVWARIAQVHPTAWFHLKQDPEQIDEAKRFSRVVAAWDRLPPLLQEHWTVVGEEYPEELVRAVWEKGRTG